MKTEFGFWEKILDNKLTGRERRQLWQKEYLSIALIINNGDRSQVAKFTGYSKRAIRIFLNEKYPDLNERWPTGYKLLNDFYKKLKNKNYYWTGRQREFLKDEHEKAMEAFKNVRSKVRKE